VEEFADHMETSGGADVSVTVIDMVKQLARLYHEGEPKWGFVPDNQKYVAELFYAFTQSGQAGDLDRFLSPEARYGTIITLFHGYSHDIIMNAIETGKRWAAEHADEHVQFLFAGGLFGVLAAVNEAVESSYWMTLALVMLAVAACLYLTYGSLVASTIFWWFSDLKFQAEMGLLLALLMLFNTFGGLVIVPAWMKIVRPRFLLRRRARAPEREPVRLAVG